MCVPHAGTPVNSAFNRRIEVRKRELDLPQDKLHDLQANLRKISNRRRPNLITKGFIYSVEEKTICTLNRYILKFKNNQIHKIKREVFNSKKGARTQDIPPHDLATPSLIKQDLVLSVKLQI